MRKTLTPWAKILIMSSFYELYLKWVPKSNKLLFISRREEVVNVGSWTADASCI